MESKEEVQRMDVTVDEIPFNPEDEVVEVEGINGNRISVSE